MLQSRNLLILLLTLIYIKNQETIAINPYEMMMKRETPQGSNEIFKKNLSKQKYKIYL